ncbi:MAG: hypothetical protein WCT99_00480 [Bacteroidota bacterium]
MNNNFLAKPHMLRITGYILFAVIVFILSLFTMPFELFFLTSVVILVTLRTIEKELTLISKKQKQQ